MPTIATSTPARSSSWPGASGSTSRITPMPRPRSSRRSWPGPGPTGREGISRRADRANRRPLRFRLPPPARRFRVGDLVDCRPLSSLVPTCPVPPRRPVMPQESGSSTRREFARDALKSLTAVVLIEGLWSRRLLGDDVRPIIDDWFKELNTISRDVHEHRVKDVEFQKSLEGLYGRVDLPSLLKSIDFDKLAAGATFPAKGAKSLPVDF